MKISVKNLREVLTCEIRKFINEADDKTQYADRGTKFGDLGGIDAITSVLMEIFEALAEAGTPIHTRDGTPVTSANRPAIRSAVGRFYNGLLKKPREGGLPWHVKQQISKLEAQGASVDDIDDLPNSDDVIRKLAQGFSDPDGTLASVLNLSNDTSAVITNKLTSVEPHAENFRNFLTYALIHRYAEEKGIEPHEVEGREERREREEAEASLRANINALNQKATVYDRILDTISSDPDTDDEQSWENILTILDQVRSLLHDSWEELDELGFEVTIPKIKARVDNGESLLSAVKAEHPKKSDEQAAQWVKNNEDIFADIEDEVEIIRQIWERGMKKAKEKKARADEWTAEGRSAEEIAEFEKNLEGLENFEGMLGDLKRRADMEVDWDDLEPEEGGSAFEFEDV